MAIQYSMTHRTNAMSQLNTDIGANAVIKIFTGSAPANCGTADTGTTLVAFAGNAGGGYDDDKPRKRRFVVKVCNKLVEYGSAQAAAKALDATEAPQPIAEVPIRAIKAQARVFKAEQKIQDLFTQQDFAAMLDLYQQMQEEDDAETLLMLI